MSKKDNIEVPKDLLASSICYAGLFAMLMALFGQNSLYFTLSAIVAASGSFWMWRIEAGRNK